MAGDIIKEAMYLFICIKPVLILLILSYRYIIGITDSIESKRQGNSREENKVEDKCDPRVTIINSCILKTNTPENMQLIMGHLESWHKLSG